MTVLSRLHLCPPLFGRFSNGLIYGFTEGTPFSVSDMRDIQKADLVAAQLGRWHKVELPMDKKPDLFRTIHKWLDAIPHSFSKQEVDAKVKSFISMQKLREEVRVDHGKKSMISFLTWLNCHR